MKFCNPLIDDFPPSRPEPSGGDSMIEPAGYIPKEVRLTNLMRSGEALDEYRKKLYPHILDVGKNHDEEFVDVTAQKGFDYFDAVNLVKNGMKLSEKRKKQAEENAALIAAREAVRKRETDSVGETESVAGNTLETNGQVTQ